MGRGKSNKPTQDFVKEQRRDFSDFLKSYIGTGIYLESKLHLCFLEKTSKPEENYYTYEFNWWRNKRNVLSSIWDITTGLTSVSDANYLTLEVFWSSPGCNNYRDTNSIIRFDEDRLQLLAFFHDEMKEETYLRNAIASCLQRGGDFRLFHVSHASLPYKPNCNPLCVKCNGYLRKLNDYAQSNLQLLLSYFSGKYLNNLTESIEQNKFSSKLELFEEINSAKKDVQKRLEDLIDIMNIDYTSEIDYYLIPDNINVSELQKLCKLGLTKE